LFLRVDLRRLVDFFFVAFFGMEVEVVLPRTSKFWIVHTHLVSVFNRCVTNVSNRSTSWYGGGGV
jgi:hypothetical protein